MYQSSKPPKWQHTSPLIRKTAIRRRLFAFLGLIICFIIWTSFISARTKNTTHKDEIATTPILSRISPKDGRIRHSSDSPDSEYKLKRIVEDIPLTPQTDEAEPKSILHNGGENQHQKPLREVPSQNSPPTLNQGLADTPLQAHHFRSNAPNNQVSENVTPDEADDGEETALRSIAVSQKGKDSSQIAGATLAEISPSEGGTEGEVSRKIPEFQGKRTSFPLYSEYMAQDSVADTLPDVVHIPFEESTSDVELQGWEDEWFSDGTFNSEKWGKLKEPKIDFIYTC